MNVAKPRPQGASGAAARKPKTRRTSPLRVGLRATLGDSKLHNRTLVLQTLFRTGPLSRADIARSTGLTKVTISGLVAELIDAGLARELGQQETQRPGKPAILVDLAREAYAVVCLDLSDHRVFRGAVLRLDGEVLVRREAPLNEAVGDAALELATTLARSLQGLSELPLLGIGIGTPGLVDDEGVVRVAPNLGWQNLPLGSIVEDLTGLPTSVGNDANISALAEYASGESSDDFILITIGHGVGSGLIIAGGLVAGHRFAAGEIGQVMVGTDLGIDATYSREQVLEHWLSAPQLNAALAAATAQAGPDAAEARDRVLREAGSRLGVALTPVVGVLNLAEIVLAGPPELVEGPLAEATLGILGRRTMPDTHDDLVLRTSPYDSLVLRGALAIVLQEQLGVA
ncbi:ROK family protein [Leucobacter sp. gxy201]|uniref:ROK family transcriptional regulator n=1 Tax=Leucobacter sp. gxy201 TaxID=2957200 RepID=UPI003D9FCFB2